jgi:hypothetical protein
MSDVCVHCGEELNLFERTRSECWACRDKISDTYSDDHLEDEPTKGPVI